MAEISKAIPAELDTDSTYAIRVRTVNNFGVASEWSDSIVFDTKGGAYDDAQRVILRRDGLLAYDKEGQIALGYYINDAVRTNYVTNPSASLATTNWSAFPNTSLTRTTTDFFIGTDTNKACFRVQATAQATEVGMISLALSPVGQGGKPFTSSAYVKVPSGQLPITINIHTIFSNSLLEQVGESINTFSITSDDKWTRIFDKAMLAPATTQYAFVALEVTSQMQAGQYFYVDGVMLENSGSLREYFDGDTSLATAWSGTANGSSSTFGANQGLEVRGKILAESGDFRGPMTVDGQSMKIGANVSGSDNGIWINTNNYWYDTGLFKVGNATSNIIWDNTDLEVKVGNTSTISIRDESGAGVIRFDNTSDLLGGVIISDNYLNLVVADFNASIAINTSTIDIHTITNVVIGNGVYGGNSEGRVHIGAHNSVPALWMGYFHDFVGSTGIGATMQRFQYFYNDGVSSFWNTVGSITITSGATAFNTSSDYRIKKDVTPLQGGLDRILALNPVKFNFIVGNVPGEGFIAHELQEHIPAAVTGEKDAVDEEGDPIYQGVDASKIVPHIVLALQELNERVTNMENGV